MKVLLFVLFLACKASLNLYAWERPDVWNVVYLHYKVFENWETDGNQIMGTSDMYVNRYFLRTVREGDSLTINNRTYFAITQMEGVFFEGDSEMGAPNRVKRIDTNYPRHRYSIGVRWENGRVYTNYEDFVYHQNCHLNGIDKSPDCFSYGDPSYLPYHFSADSTELILYDYTMEVGDSYRHIEGYDDITVVKKDTVVLSGDNIKRRRLTLNNGLILIEGLGCINSNGMFIDYLNPEAKYSSRFTYLADASIMINDDKTPLIYDQEKDGNQIIKDSSTSINNIFSNQSQYKNAFFDLQGRKLSKEPGKGVYIRNGKVMVR